MWTWGAFASGSTGGPWLSTCTIALTTFTARIASRSLVSSLEMIFVIRSTLLSRSSWGTFHFLTAVSMCRMSLRVCRSRVTLISGMPVSASSSAITSSQIHLRAMWP